MYSTKKNVLELAALMLAHGVTDVVVSPGSRNAPIIQTLAQHPDFRCYTVVDERSAAFFALGLIQKLQRPVAVCCTSGTALLNFSSAVAEAFYQQLPLLVISADRPLEWIGQMDGQTLPQSGAFRSLVKRSVQLPEPKNEQEEWFCNRLINEALLDLTRRANGPVHINVPISDPLFDFSATQLPAVRTVSYTCAAPVLFNNNELSKQWQESTRKMVVVGQLLPDEKVKKQIQQLAAAGCCVVFAEHIANVACNDVVANFDEILYALPHEQYDAFTPDLLITIGGHIVSKRLKKFLRDQKPTHHWHVTLDGSMPDLFQSLTDILECDNVNFLSFLMEHSAQQSTSFASLWKNQSEQLRKHQAAYCQTLPYSDLLIIKQLFPLLPANAALQLGNSSTIRNAQLFVLNTNIPVYCNRGTSGIDGSVSTAVGFAAVSSAPTFLVVGDLSFFYDVNGLWNKHVSKNLRILLVNNGGGEIFHLLPGLNKAESLEGYISCSHTTGAKEWAEAMGIQYLSATNEDELCEGMGTFVNMDTQKAVLFEVKTQVDVNAAAFKAYYHHLK